MFFDAEKEFDRKKAVERVNYLLRAQKKFEIVEKKPIRSLSQNNYLHLLLSYVAMHTGYTLEEVKQQIFKQEVNPTIFYDGEFGEKVKIHRWRSTSRLDKGEMTMAIERFRNYCSAELGLYLPEPADLAHLEEIRNESLKYSNQMYL